MEQDNLQVYIPPRADHSHGAKTHRKDVLSELLSREGMCSRDARGLLRKMLWHEVLCSNCSIFVSRVWDSTLRLLQRDICFLQ